MKHTPTIKPATAHIQAGKVYAKTAGDFPIKNTAGYGSSFLEKKGKSKVGKGGRSKSKKAQSVDALEEDARTETRGGSEPQENSLGIYLNEIGAVELLDSEGERTLGREIRAQFGALLTHLLRSGYVMEVLLERTRVELGYSSLAAPRRAALVLALEECSAALGRARELFARDGCLVEQEMEVLRDRFSDLLAKLDFWQTSGLELLDLLSAAYSGIENTPHDGSGAGLRQAAREAFRVANLMEIGECEVFLKQALGLKSRALNARNKLMVPNLRLVVKAAKSLPRRMLSFNEMIQEGNLGLLQAAERFDERLGFRFSTFAMNLIKAKMKRENDNQGRMIRVPVYQCEALRRLDKVRVELENTLGREATASELALEAGLKPLEFVELSALKAGCVSLDQSVNEDGENALEQSVPDPESVTPFYGRIDLAGKLDPHLEGLEEVERRVVCCLFGLGGVPSLSVQETAAHLGISVAELGRVRDRALGTIRDRIVSPSELYACAA